jgi:signal transduction histidine kinase
VKLPSRLRLRRARKDEPESAPPPSARNGSDEDARILRRTRLRLLAWSGGITLLILIVLGASLYLVVSRYVASAGEQRVNQRIDTVEDGLRSNLRPNQVSLGIIFGGPSAGTWAYIIVSGSPPYTPTETYVAGNVLPDMASVAIAETGKTDARVVTVSGVGSYRVISRQFQTPDGTTYVVQGVEDRSAETKLLDTLFLILLGGGAMALLASLAAGYVYAGRALVPIRDSVARRQAALLRQREFAANASHELRTPLTVVRASVEDLRRNRRSRVEDVGEAIDDIDVEVRHMTALVEDMLLLARTDSGTIQIEPVPLDLADVAADAASSLVTLGQERGVKVVLDPRPAPVSGDSMRLRQLVTILVDNAIRHSRKDSTVTVNVRPDDTSSWLYVEDEGPGIRPADLPRLWERFWRADNAPAGGTGLGLAIAKWIVDQHGGTIGAMNRDEGGARFWVRLPLLAGASTPAADEPSPKPAGQAPKSGDTLQWSPEDHGEAT